MFDQIAGTHLVEQFAKLGYADRAQLLVNLFPDRIEVAFAFEERPQYRKDHRCVLGIGKIDQSQRFFRLFGWRWIDKLECQLTIEFGWAIERYEFVEHPVHDRGVQRFGLPARQRYHLGNPGAVVLCSEELGQALACLAGNVVGLCQACFQPGELLDRDADHAGELFAVNACAQASQRAPPPTGTLRVEQRGLGRRAMRVDVLQ